MLASLKQGNYNKVICQQQIKKTMEVKLSTLNRYLQVVD